MWRIPSRAVSGARGNGEAGQGCPQDCCETDGARDPKRCFERPVPSVGCVAEAEPVPLTCEGKPPATVQRAGGHGTVPCLGARIPA